eukprot:TRINITY_DN71201_c0_g1_i1.p1 TRINITY_DN71201_c0_g1~~TRINITY_DN71201_c0_g1_i1.p1  ORF type:complete len:981 (-),score=287.46 TRINITY_DN71201_c0_g1_i1:75-3017(-)
MSTPAEQCVVALQTLATSADPAAQKQAEEWIAALEREPQGWEVYDQMLAASNVPAEMRYVGAQTIRMLAQRDFEALPAGSGEKLRDALFERIEQADAQAPQGLSALLIATLADVAIQGCSERFGPLVFERWGQKPEHFASLLELLTILPEASACKHMGVDGDRRAEVRDAFRKLTPEVLQFLTRMQASTEESKKLVLQCMLAWTRFTKDHADDIGKNPLMSECFSLVVEGGELCSVSSHVIIEALRLCSFDLDKFGATVDLLLSKLVELRARFDKAAESGDAAAFESAPRQIWKIYTEVGVQLLPLIVEHPEDAKYADIVQTILRCTDVPVPELSAITFDFWHALKEEAVREEKEKSSEITSTYEALLRVLLTRAAVDPSAAGGGGAEGGCAEEERAAHRRELLEVVEDCVEILTPENTLEKVLASLESIPVEDASSREAHLACLAVFGSWIDELSQSPRLATFLEAKLLPLVGESPPAWGEDLLAQYFLRKTAMDLLSVLWKVKKTQPEFLRTIVDALSKVLLRSPPSEGSSALTDCARRFGESAARLFRDICYRLERKLQDAAQQLVDVCVAGVKLQIQAHTFIIEGVVAVLSDIDDDKKFLQHLDTIVSAFAKGVSDDSEKSQALTESLDRLTTLIRKVDVGENGPKVTGVGVLINEKLWPLIKQMLAQYPTDSYVAEKSCRLLKHSVRCVPASFKPNAAEAADTLMRAAEQSLHSSYLYSAEILAGEYASDSDMMEVLRKLFNTLSGAAIKRLCVDDVDLEDHAELLEDLYGMFSRYMHYAPQLVSESPNLTPTLQLLSTAITVRQRDALESVFSFIENIYAAVDYKKAQDGDEDEEEQKRVFGEAIKPHLRDLAPEFLKSIFRLIVNVPVKYTRENIARLIDTVQMAFSDDCATWLKTAISSELPESLATWAEQHHLAVRLSSDDNDVAEGIIQDLCSHCELLAAWNQGAAQTKSQELAGATRGRDSEASTEADQ